MDEHTFAELLKRPEGETIDFKETGYNFSEERSRIRFVKDVVAFANTPREEDAFIVLGVRRNTDGSNVLLGVREHPDDEQLQTQVAARVGVAPLRWTLDHWARGP